MGCFDFFKKTRKHKQQAKSAATSEPVSSFVSTYGTSRSEEDSVVLKRVSKSSDSASSHRSIPSLYEERGHNLRVFDYRELRIATNDFSRLLKIGEGGFGSVYKGLVRPPGGKGDDIRVAVKKLNQNGLQVLLSIASWDF